MKVRDIIEILEQDGWFKVNQEGSHRQYKHPVKRGRVTVNGTPGDDVERGDFGSILRQAGLQGQVRWKS